MLDFLNNIDDSIRTPLVTTAGGVLALLIALVPYLIIARFRRDTSESHDDDRAREPILAPLLTWLGLTLGILIAFLLVYPRNSWSDVWWPKDANLRTIHAFAAGSLAALLAFPVGRFAPALVGAVWRGLLGAGVGVLTVWLVGWFLVENETWTLTKFWWIAGGYAFASGALWAVICQPCERAHAPALTLLTSAALLGAGAAPVFLSSSTTMAHSLGAAGIAFALIGLAAFRWGDLGRSSIAPALAISVLTTAIAIPLIYEEKMLIATLVPLALAPLALVVHRLPSIIKLPGPAWLLPGVLQLLVLIALVGTAAAFASGVLEINPEKLPWREDDENGEGDSAESSYDEYDFYQ